MSVLGVRRAKAAFFSGCKSHPGNFVTVQKLLGHKNIKTTITFYAKLDTATAAQHYDALIAEEREALVALAPPRRRRQRS